MREELQITNYELQANGKLNLGSLGETYAAHYLQACGYSIVSTNWQHGHREIDLVGYTENPQPKWLFVEVKSGELNSDPFQHFSKRKQKDFSLATEAYIEKHHLWEQQFQADLICLNISKMEIINLDHYPDVI